MKSCSVVFLAVVTTIAPVVAFAPLVFQQQQQHRPTTNLHAEETEKAAPIITGEELERMLTEWDTPLVVDGTYLHRSCRSEIKPFEGKTARFIFANV